VDRFIVPQLNDKQLARSAKGVGGLAYTHPESLADETIETYFRPLVETPQPFANHVFVGNDNSA
jgi:hypothetical protein